MTKLYYAPRQSEFAADSELETELVSPNLRTASGEDFHNINSSGNLPCLVLDNGTVIDDRSKICDYIAHHHSRHHEQDHNDMHSRMYSVLSLVKSSLPERSPTHCEKESSEKRSMWRKIRRSFEF